MSYAPPPPWSRALASEALGALLLHRLHKGVRTMMIKGRPSRASRCAVACDPKNESPTRTV